MSDQQRSSSGTPAVPRQLTGRARRIMAHGFTDDTGLFVSDLHAHATVIYHSLSQTLNFISSHMDKHADCPCTDLIDAALYVQTARDRLMQGLVKTFDDQIAAQDRRDADEFSSDDSGIDSDDQVDVVDNVD